MVFPPNNYNSEENFENPDKNKNKNKNGKNDKTNMKKAEEAVRQLRSSFDADADMKDIKSDMLGSYTGIFYDGTEPDQDADDL